MSENVVPIPASSQTVGPYFRIGLEYLIDRTPSPHPHALETIEMRGRVLDRDGAPVPDAMLEFWCASTGQGRAEKDAQSNFFPPGFRRAVTDEKGSYSVVMQAQAASNRGDELTQPPHFLVLVFARGLLRHLLSRVYLGSVAAKNVDPVFMSIAEERRPTLIAHPDEEREALYWWDVILQGANETVFFAW